MSEKKVGKRLLTWVLVLVMTLSLLPLNVLAANPAVMRIVRPDTDKYITYNFYLNEGDKTPYYSQIIKNNESLDAPATPEKKDYKFVGWYDGDEQFSNFGTAITVTEGSTDVDLYAKFVPVCYVYFMDGTGEGARIIATKEVTATDPLNDFSDVAFPIGADEAITGWVDKDNNPVTSVSFSDGTTYLYPVVEKGHWIEFNSNGGSYVAPLFVAKNAQLSSLPEPTKHGYSFDSWYTDKEMTNKFEACTNAVKEAQNQELLDFVARRLYEMAAVCIMSHLIIQDATKAPELFGKSALVYVNYAEAEVEKHFNFIRKFKAEELESYRK